MNTSSLQVTPVSSKIASTIGVISCNETAAAVVYILVLGCPGQSKWKLSKAMESNLEAEKEIFKEQDKLNAECNEYLEAKLKMKNKKYSILMTSNARVIFQEISLLWLYKKTKENAWTMNQDG